MLEVALVGCGRMGTLHARTIAAHPACRLAACVDIDPARSRALADRYGAEARSDVPPGVAAVVVASPATTHAGILRAWPDRWCLVEKPLADLPDDALDLPRAMVGHTERLHPALPRLLAPPRRVRARRLCPPTGRGLDVHVALDLMIHDIDLVLSWTDGSACLSDAGGGRDYTWARLVWPGGVAELTASRVAHTPERRLDIDGVDIDLSLPRIGPDALSRQWAAFVAFTRGKAPIVSARDGLRALKIASSVAARAAS